MEDRFSPNPGPGCGYNCCWFCCCGIFCCCCIACWGEYPMGGCPWIAAWGFPLKFMPLFFFLRQRKMIPRISSAITATPPTTPPTMGPMGTDFEAVAGAGVGVTVDDDDVDEWVVVEPEEEDDDVVVVVSVEVLLLVGL